MNTGEELGRFIKQLRVKKDLTLTELAEKTGMSQSYLSQVENAKKGIPSPDALKKLSEPLEVPHKILLFAAGYLDEEDLSRTDYETGFFSFVDIKSEKIYEGTGAFDEKEKRKELQLLKRIERMEIENEDLSYELLHVLGGDIPAYYNGHKLEEQDKQRVIDMLALLFPDKSHK